MKKLTNGLFLLLLMFPGTGSGGNQMAPTPVHISTARGVASLRVQQLEAAFETLPDNAGEQRGRNPVLAALMWLLESIRLCFAGWAFGNLIVDKVEQFPTALKSAGNFSHFMASGLTASLSVAAEVLETGINETLLTVVEWLFDGKNQQPKSVR